MLRDPQLEKMARIATFLGATMGQSTPPISAESQQLNAVANSTASLAGIGTVGGAAIFKFPAVTQGQTWTGTVCLASAPDSSSFAASIGATSWGTWGGNSVAGPVQGFGGQQLIVSVTGLVPGADYVMTWTGSADPQGTVAPIWPDVNSSALSVNIQSPYDVLATINSLTVPAGSFLNIGPYQALGTYQAVEVIFGGVSSNPNQIIVTFANQTTGQSTVVTGEVGSLQMQFIAELACSAGDFININIQSAPGAFVNEAQVIGFRQSPLEFVANAPNTPLYDSPVGGQLFVFQNVPAGTAVATLNAPPAGKAYRLHQFGSNIAVAGAAQLTDTVVGHLYAASTTSVPLTPLNGLICLEALHVFNSAGAGNAACTLFYDLVTIPTVT